MQTDKVLLEILNNRFSAIVNEMGYIVYRTGFTVFVKETQDYGVGLVAPTGELFAYPQEVGVANMLGMPMEDAIATIPEYRPGDVIITNDPYTTGGMCTHLPDIHLYKPFFYKGELICFLWDFIHSSDVGGLVPGSIAPSAYDIYQEGLIIPPRKLYREGKLDQELLDMILANCRIPEQNWGDLKALLAALNTGERRLTEVIERYGVETVKQGITDLLAYGEQSARAIIADIPDGTYTFSDYVEGDVTTQIPLRIKLALTVQGSDMYLDFTGTDPQIRAAFNVPTFGKTHHWLTVGLVTFLRTKNPSIPLNKGILRPVHTTVPSGTLLNPVPPASCGIRYATAIRVIDVTFGALSQAIDDVVPAAGAGQVAIVLISMPDYQSGGYKVSVLQPMQGGSGGRPVKDGIDGGDFSAGFLRNIPTEMLEADIPILVHKYMFPDDTLPAGQFRGGLGVDFRFQVFTPHCIVTARGMERHRFRPWGRKGGSAGTRALTKVNPGTEQEQNIGIIDILKLEPYDLVQIMTPCGGGYGDPLDRDPDKVLKDVEDEFITREAAESEYGVVIRNGRVDQAQTEALRHRLQTSRILKPFDYGSEREEYEWLWPPEVQD
ncbi:MAG: hydantoinase B/oxoprolinase family protein, partial [Nitrospinota bacterium]